MNKEVKVGSKGKFWNSDKNNNYYVGILVSINFDNGRYIANNDYEYIHFQEINEQDNAEIQDKLLSLLSIYQNNHIAISKKLDIEKRIEEASKQKNFRADYLLGKQEFCEKIINDLKNLIQRM